MTDTEALEKAIEPAANIGLHIAAKYSVGFPGLKLAKEICDAIKSAHEAATLAERERCAKLAENSLRAVGCVLLPQGWLAEEFARIDSTITRWPDSVKASFDAARIREGK